MKNKLPIFLLSSAILCFIAGFFKSNPPGSSNLYYPVFAIILFLIAIACLFVCVVIAASWMGEFISYQRKFQGQVYKPMPEEKCDGGCAPGECICSDRAAHPELYDETEVMHAKPYEPKAAAYTEEMVPFVAEDVHAGEESHHDTDELPKEDFKGFVEATPAPTPQPVAPHEDQSHPNYDHAAGRIIYK